MHKLNLDETTSKISVDDQSQSRHNQDSSTSVTTQSGQGSRQFSQELNGTMKKASTSKLLVFCFVAIVLGVGTGWGAHKLSAKPGLGGGSHEALPAVAGDVIKNGDVFGSSNDEAFPDKTQGYLEAGGLNGEGSHKLLKPGGDSQTVYLTSSVTDLDKFVGMEVKISGQTFQGQKAGWLIDVGRVEVINTEGIPPEEN